MLLSLPLAEKVSNATVSKFTVAAVPAVRLGGEPLVNLSFAAPHCALGNYPGLASSVVTASW